MRPFNKKFNKMVTILLENLKTVVSQKHRSWIVLEVISVLSIEEPLRTIPKKSVKFGDFSKRSLSGVIALNCS